MVDELSSEDVRRARLEAGWSVAEAARQLKRRSTEPLPTLTSLIRSWKRWEAGTHPSRPYQPLLVQLFESPDDEAPVSVQRSVPTVWRRWLAIELRRLREDAGLSRQDAAQACGWPTARISYVEDVQQTVVEDDLERLLPVYGVPTHRWNVYFDAASERASRRGWWQRSDERVLPEWASLHYGLERGATRIRAREVLAIPGLLQTFDYAVEVLGTDLVPKTKDQITEEATSRVNRQVLLDGSLECSAVIDQTALTQMPDNPAVMVPQLQHLIDLAGRPNVTIRVLRSRVLHGYTFGFSILEFPWTGDPGVVYTEHRDGALFLEEPHEVIAHSQVFQHLCTLALDPDASIATIQTIAEKVQKP